MDQPMPKFKGDSSTSPLAASAFLHRHEVASLRTLSVLRLIMSAICLVGITMTASQGQLWQSLAILPQIPVALITLLTVQRTRFPHRLGFLGTVADSVVLFLLPALFAYSNAFPVTSTSLLKNDIEMFVLGFAIANSITLRPAQPILIGCASALSQIGYYFYAVHSFGPLPLTDSWLATIETPAIQLGGFWFNSLILIPTLCILLGVLAQRGRQNILHAASLERDTTTLERYFSPNVVAQIRMAPDLYSKLGGQQREIAVMFIDLRSFTHLSEQQPPDETVALLSDYYQHLADAVFGQGGSIDKFLGDGLMATFGMLGQEEPASIAHNAIRAGLAVRAALAQINTARQAQGKPPLQQGIGIHFGKAVVGNFGTAQRMEFTAVGDTVNVASRVQEMCKEFKVDFLVTRAVVEHLGIESFPFRSRGEMPVRGKTLPIEVYEVGRD